MNDKNFKLFDKESMEKFFKYSKTVIMIGGNNILEWLQ